MIRGLSLSVCTNDAIRDYKNDSSISIPSLLLFTDILDTQEKTQDAEKKILDSKNASCFNLIVADQNKAKRIQQGGKYNNFPDIENEIIEYI
ncbi:MAG: hypothetical protein CMO81_08810 [Waddliaceae bacterium]|nr:hypothetical protein [Waddliaceae bacterium]